MRWTKYFSVLLVACAGSNAAIVEKELEARPKLRPQWLDQGLKKNDGFVWVAGQSKATASEQEARDGALAAATMEFVKFAGVEVEAFDRSVETYSQVGDKTLQTMDAEQRATVRAKAFVKNAAPDQWYVRKMAKMRGEKQEGEHYLAAVLLKVPDSELERIQKEKTTKLSVDLALYRQGRDKLEVVSDGDVLKSGESYALFVQPSDGCFLYVYQTDAAGATFRLFPNPEFKTEANPIAGGKDLWVPNAEHLLTLDETTGKERIHVFAALEKIPELENAVKLEDKQLSSVIKTMGVAGLSDKRSPHKAEPPKGATAVADVKKKLLSHGAAFVYETWFYHR
ncbi:MAG: DUF4384 domain-containing protein [Deltaproteobacteria bacterium]|nr:DUF4384 domain-containing protein [Deltaproteobacteria bacterium]